MMKNRTLFLIGAIVLCSRTTRAQTSGSFVFDGEERTYLTYLPAGFAETDTLPLVFALHGLLMSAQSMWDMVDFAPIADEGRFIVVCPNGVSSQWNTFSSPYHSGVDDVGFLSALIDTINANHHINLSRVYSTGMSNGGYMSYRLACELSDRIAAIASVTGVMTDSMQYYCAPQRPVPVLHMHGTNDLIVAYGEGEPGSVESSLAYYVTHNGCPATPEITALSDTDPSDNCTAEMHYWGTCDNGTEVIHYLIADGGHTWPGSGENFFGVGGNVNMDINGSQIIWDFFNRHSLEGPILASIDENGNEGNDMELFPNPTDAELNLRSDGMPMASITITDLSGRTVASHLNVQGANPWQLDLSAVPEGMYLLQATNDSKKLMKRVIVR